MVEDELGVEWRTVEGFPNYTVSSDGRLRFTGGMQHREGWTPWHRPPAAVASIPDKDGYLRVRMLKNGRRHRTTLHRLVAKAFIPNPLNKDQINHVDGDKTNNEVSNLEWSTCKENHAHRRYILKKNIGENHGCAKLTEMEVRKIRASSTLSSYELAEQYRVSSANIRSIRRGETWSHIIDDQRPQL